MEGGKSIEKRRKLWRSWRELAGGGGALSETATTSVSRRLVPPCSCARVSGCASLGALGVLAAASVVGAAPHVSLHSTRVHVSILHLIPCLVSTCKLDT